MIWKRIFALTTLVLVIGTIWLVKGKSAEEKLLSAKIKTELKDGDLIFQTSLSGQSLAIQKATQSNYSHCGIIYKNGNEYVVFEAVQPVKLTKLTEWIARGKDGKYVIKRLKDANKIINKATLAQMKAVGKQLVWKPYDSSFEWSDDRIYCSELIWKVYQRATGIELGKLQKLSDFDLSDPVVKEKISQRFGTNIPLNESVISPKAIVESNLLVTIASN